MKILITNDDGYKARGLDTLVRMMRPYGDLLVVAPKSHQSGVSMGISMGYRPIGIKKISETAHETWYYVDGTPASCVKYGIDNIMAPVRPDIVVSGINHGGNYATASLYSGTVGAAMEAAVNRIPAIGISLDSFSPDADFSAVEELFPPIFESLLSNMEHSYGRYYNVNFPLLPADRIKGVKAAPMGRGHWEKEYQPYTRETFERLQKMDRFDPDARLKSAPGEDVFVMVGDFTDEQDNVPEADHRLVADGYISVCAHNINNTDYAELKRLDTIFK